MSHSASYTYELIQQRKRQLYLSRIMDNTMNFHRRFTQMYRSMINEGLMQFVPSELANLDRDLGAVSSVVNSDAERAAEMCKSIGAYITSIRPLAAEVRRATEVREAAKMAEAIENVKKAGKEISDYLNSLLAGMTDPVVRDFAIDGITEIRKFVETRRNDPAGTENVKSAIAEKFERVIKAAEVKAGEWKAAKKKENEKTAKLEMIAIQKERLADDLKGNREALDRVTSLLDSSAALLEKGSIDADAAMKKAEECVEEAEKTIMDEKIRKETVIMIGKSLRDAGFDIEIQGSAGDASVRILARKPSGSRAVCLVNINGEFKYKFDGYEGKACKKDIAAFKGKLDDVYGVKLSKERTIWENPDRINSEARPIKGDKKNLK